MQIVGWLFPALICLAARYLINYKPTGRMTLTLGLAGWSVLPAESATGSA